MTKRLRRKIRAKVIKYIAFILVFFAMFLLLNYSSTVEHLKNKRRPLGNYEPPAEEITQGNGEGGLPHYTTSSKAQEVYLAMSRYGINMVASAEISQTRTIPDFRSDECRYWQYSYRLPVASVVIVAYNEGLSTLLRTINSVLSRTPAELLEEIILVDDKSDIEDMGERLEIYLHPFAGHVRLVRNQERQGLIQSRVTGAKVANGEVLVFLDAHCEVGVNWLPPLLEPIKRNVRTMTIPVIDTIDKNTFAFSKNYRYDQPLKGIFDWGLLNKEIALSARERRGRQNETAPYKTATHQGGLFAIDRRYFRQIGYYDRGLLIWGGENLELSFKVWQCGGSILWVPCSRVAHIFKTAPNRLGSYVPTRWGPLFLGNFRRVVEVWMEDPFKEYFYARQPMALYVEMGDIRQELLLKMQLQCNSFQWYMDNVAYDVYRDFPAPPPNLHWGILKNRGSELCLDTMTRVAPSTLGVSQCYNSWNFNLFFRINMMGQLAVGERCVEADNTGVRQVFCPLGRVDGPWKYMAKDLVLYNTRALRCLGQKPRTRLVSLVPCDSRNTYLQWSFLASHLNKSLNGPASERNVS